MEIEDHLFVAPAHFATYIWIFGVPESEMILKWYNKVISFLVA